MEFTGEPLRSAQLVPILPEGSEAVGGELGVPGRVLDVAVPKPVLDGAGVVAVIGELEAAGVPQHVRVDGEGELGAAPIAVTSLRTAETVSGPRRSLVNT